MPPNNIICALQNFAPMKFSELLAKIESNYIAGAISDEQLVQIIELANDYLILKTTTNTAEFQKKSYNGIKRYSNPVIIIDGVKFYINNE